MNIQEAWCLNPTIHSRQGVSMTRHLAEQTANITIQMAREVCADFEAEKYLPPITNLLGLLPSQLYVELDSLGMVWIAINTRIERLSFEESARIISVLQVPIDDGWFPGPAPAPVVHPGSLWYQAYRCLNDGEPETFYWKIRQPTHNAIMKYDYKPARHAGGQVEWGFTITVNNKRMGEWFPASNPAAITTALLQGNVPLDGWYTARDAERQYAIGIMQRAGILG